MTQAATIAQTNPRQHLGQLALWLMLPFVMLLVAAMSLDAAMQNAAPAEQTRLQQDQEESETSDQGSDAEQGDDGDQEADSDQQRSRRFNFGKTRKENRDSLKLFEPVVANARLATVKILCNESQIALGLVVDANGKVLTKASELQGPLTCRFADGRETSATVMGYDPQTDLALLDTSATALPVPKLEETLSDPEVGSWVAVPGPSTSPLAFGVISVANREIPQPPGFMGIQFAMEKQDERGVLIESVMPGLPADRAGLRDGDVLVVVQGKRTKNRSEVVQEVLGKAPGTRIDVKVLRGTAGVESEHQIILGNREELDPTMKKANYQNTLGNHELSERRKDFKLAFRHDCTIQPDECGGPLVDLDGRVIGINIARAGRVESLALPNSIVIASLKKLMTGEFSPAVVNAEKIKIVRAQLAEVSNTALLEQRKDQAAGELDVQSALADELSQIAEDLEKRIADAEKARDAAQSKLDELRKKLENKSVLEEQLRMLESGIR